MSDAEKMAAFIEKEEPKKKLYDLFEEAYYYVQITLIDESWKVQKKAVLILDQIIKEMGGCLIHVSDEEFHKVKEFSKSIGGISVECDREYDDEKDLKAIIIFKKYPDLFDIVGEIKKRLQGE